MSEDRRPANKELLGRYALSVATLPGYLIDVTEDAEGIVQIVPFQQPSKELIQISRTHFQLKQARSITLDFIVEEDGRVDGFQIRNLFGIRHYRRLDILNKEFDVLYSPEVSTLGENLYAIPVDLNDGLTSRSIDEVGAEAAYIYRLLANLRQGFFGNVNSFLIMKNGALVLEQYFNNWSLDRPHQMRSVSKSVASLLVGSAIDQGHIDSVDDPIAKYLPQYDLNEGIEKITLKDLLTMSAGLSWDQLSVDYASSENINQRVEQSADSVAFVLARKQLHKPGTVFNYSDGYAYIAGEVLRNATGSKSVQAYIENSTLAALRLGPTPWSRLADGRQATAFGLQLRPRDLAKVGQMLLDDGRWQGKEVLSESWIAESTSAHISTTSSLWEEYGYYWWGTNFRIGDETYHADLADGFGGQYLIVIKELDLVIVSTAENFNFPYQKVMSDIMIKLVIPAFQ